MLKFIKPLAVILCLICFTGIGFSQNNGQKTSNFVSKEDGFQIDLPANTYKFSQSETSEIFATKLSKFRWESAEGIYQIAYADFVKKPEDPKDFVEKTGQRFSDGIVAKGGTLLSTKELSLDGNPGMDVRVRLKNGFTGVTRYYLVKKRLYTLFSVWEKDEEGKIRLKVLDSFKLRNSDLPGKPAEG